MTLTKKILPLVALATILLPGTALAAPKPKAKVQFSSSAYAVIENAGSAPITIVRPRTGHSLVRLSQPMTVEFSTSDGSAKAGTDYTAVDQTVSFPACTGTPAASDPCVSQTVQVPVINNSVIDGARTVNLKLSNASSPNGRAVLGYPSTATLVIADDDATNPNSQTFQMVDASDIVSESAGTEPVFIVRSGDLTASATVNYATQDGTAVAGTDYTAVSGSHTFAPNEILYEVDVPILHNGSLSAPATSNFNFNLSIPSGNAGQLGTPSSETVTIVNADGTPTLAFSAPTYSVNENGSSVRLTVIAAGSITGSNEVDVDYATADGSAKAGVNYTATGDTLQFFAGDVAESFDVPVLDDGLPGDKSFTAALSKAAGGSLADPSTATVNVLNTDQPASSGGSGANGGGQGNQFVADTRAAACGLTMKAANKQRLVKQKGLKLTLRTSEACKVTLSALLKQASSKKKSAKSARSLRFAGKKTSLTLQPGKAKTVTVKFTNKTLKAITKALRARKALVATVTVTTRNSASTVAHRTLKITVRR